MMAYISASPFLFQDLMGLSTLQYGIVFGGNALALTGVTWLSARLTRRCGVRHLSAVRNISGTGSAFLGLLQFVLAGMIAPLVSLGDGTSKPLAATMFITSTIACLAFYLGSDRRNHRQKARNTHLLM